MFEDDVGKDDIVLFLHEVASDIDEEEEHKRQWRICTSDRNHPATMRRAPQRGEAVSHIADLLTLLGALLAFPARAVVGWWLRGRRRRTVT